MSHKEDVLEDLRVMCKSAVAAFISGQPYGEENHKVKIESIPGDQIYISFTAASQWAPKHPISVSGNKNPINEMMARIRDGLGY